MKIAIDAGKSEIGAVIAPAVNPGNDVLDVQSGERRIILMQVTLLASVLRTLANLGPDRSANHSDSGVGDLLCLSLENRDELVCPHIACVFGVLIFRELTFG